MAVSRDGSTLYVACAASNRILWLDAAAGNVLRSVAAPPSPAALLLSPEGARLHVACAAPRSRILTLDARSGKLLSALDAGHTTEALAAAGGFLFAASRFQNSIAAFDLSNKRQAGSIPAEREPQGLALTPDGRWLFASNALPAGRADVEYVAASVSVIDAVQRKPAGRIPLPNGSTGLRQIAVSPDGKFAAVAHVLARYYLPATQLDRGWMGTNALSLLDARSHRLLGTVLLDEIDRGAANPWAVAWTPGGERLLVTHAGTHEISLIDAPALIAKLAAAPEGAADDLRFLLGLRKRIPLQSRGPRALTVHGNTAWVAGYFSDTIEVLKLDQPDAKPRLLATLSSAAPSVKRRGEMLFNDGAICFQGWQSCATCHSPDGRVDGLNWDLLNDGIGNPKNSRSLLLAHRTPPAMSHGVREKAEHAVRSGLRVILFAQRPEEEAAAIDEYLKSLKPLPSPALQNGKLSPAAQRGRKIFMSARTQCASCHPPGLYTDLKSYDVGTRAPTDSVSEFDTPTLIEIWRTAPYLHDGSAATLLDVLTTRNKGDRHGKTSHLTPAQIDDLLEFLRSL